MSSQTRYVNSHYSGKLARDIFFQICRRDGRFADLQQPVLEHRNNWPVHASLRYRQAVGLVLGQSQIVYVLQQSLIDKLRGQKSLAQGYSQSTHCQVDRHYGRIGNQSMVGSAPGRNRCSFEPVAPGEKGCRGRTPVGVDQRYIQKVFSLCAICGLAVCRT